MRIEKIEGYNFPVTIVCDNVCNGMECGTTFTVTMPADMRRVGVWQTNWKAGETQPQKTGERILAKCPCCGEDYEVDAKCISSLLRLQIPYDKSSNPVVGHW